MTGKFHTTWGEFGGFKHPNALRYEEALCVAFGAKCSIGDQLHPDGHFEEATYDLIGAAYRDIEKREPWLDNVRSVADIAILSEEAIENYYGSSKIIHHGGADADAGAVRIMLEGKYLFDVIDTEQPLDGYKLLILPDHIRLDGSLTEKIKAFTAGGGKVLATGESGLDENDSFTLDLGCDYVGQSGFKPVYFRPKFSLGCLGDSAYVIYEQCTDIKARDGAEIPVVREDPYFNRTTFAFSSHQHTPNDKSTCRPAATIGTDGGYISTELFCEYAHKGSLIAKLIAEKMIDLILGNNKTLVTNLPAQGVVTLMDQTEEKRLVNHLLYASPVRRGSGIEVIEDIVPVYGVNVTLNINKEPKRVYLAPENKDIPFSYKNGRLSYTVEKLDLHAMVITDY